LFWLVNHQDRSVPPAGPVKHGNSRVLGGDVVIISESWPLATWFGYRFIATAFALLPIGVRAWQRRTGAGAAARPPLLERSRSPAARWDSAVGYV